MIQLTEKIWIGDSSDERHADVHSVRITAILNVAQDLQATRGWEDLTEYMQVGLIDGPGNPMAAYYAAVFALYTLLERGSVLVCCHNGGRSLAVVLMYMVMTGGRAWPGDWRPVAGWDGWLKVFRDKSDRFPFPNKAHKEVFDKMNWRLLANIVES